MGNTPGQPASAGQIQQQPTKHKAGEKPEKGEKQQKRPQTPFHHRNFICDDVSIETDASTGQRRFPGLRPSDVLPKPPQLHSSGGAVGGVGVSAEIVGSPQPPPLSPHLDEGSEDTPEALKNSSMPHSQHFYSSSEPCLQLQKADSRADPHAPPFHAAYPEAMEPTVFVGAAVSLEDDGSHMPWRFFNLPRRKDLDFPTPALPADKLREEAALGADGSTSITE